ncbi:MAG: hypothetical protein R3246_13470, partial [Acidimicrobiia bacterium]|nr:hypothetical protein [Acidimicrobiia bacterium]
RRVQREVDRLFHRSRFDAERVAREFGDSLQGLIDVESVIDDFAAVVGTTLNPVRMAVWLASADGPEPFKGPGLSGTARSN